METTAFTIIKIPHEQYNHGRDYVLRTIIIKGGILRDTYDGEPALKEVAKAQLNLAVIEYMQEL